MSCILSIQMCQSPPCQTGLGVPDVLFMAFSKRVMSLCNLLGCTWIAECFDWFVSEIMSVTENQLVVGPLGTWSCSKQQRCGKSRLPEGVLLLWWLFFSDCPCLFMWISFYISTPFFLLSAPANMSVLCFLVHLYGINNYFWVTIQCAWQFSNWQLLQPELW